MGNTERMRRKPSCELRGDVVMFLMFCAIAAVFAGCASGHQRFFKSALAQPHPSLAEYDGYNVAVFTGEPKVYFQQLDDTLGRQLSEDGFVMLGYSSFNGRAEGANSIKAEAKRIGAEVVVAESQYSHTVSGAVPVTTYSPQTYQSSGTVWGSSGSWATYSGTTTGTSRQTAMMPYSVARYDQSASFWTRTVRPRILGAVTTEMSAQDRQKVGANQGVRVIACVRDSPAWQANVLPGDYILAIDAQPVSSVNGLADRLVSLAGQRVSLSIMRGNEHMEIVVVLNPNPIPQIGTTKR